MSHHRLRLNRKVEQFFGSHSVVGDPGVPSVPDVKKIPCPKCNSTFTRVDNLRRHMRTYHSEQEECSLDPANMVEAVMDSPPNLFTPKPVIAKRKFPASGARKMSRSSIKKMKKSHANSPINWPLGQTDKRLVSCFKLFP